MPKLECTPGMPEEKKERILIVDDSEMVLQGAASVLTNAGYRVVATSQTVGASRHLATCALVIIDFHMPGFNGKDLVASMREAIKTSARRPLLYLYTSDEAAAKDYRALGFDGCFTDKGDPRALLDQVESVFRLIHMRGIAARVRRAFDE